MSIDKSGKAKSHRVKAPIQTELRTLLNRVIQRVVRRLERDGLLIPAPEQAWLDLDFHEAIHSLSAASIRYRIVIGPHSGSRTLTLHDPSFIQTAKPAHIDPQLFKQVCGIWGQSKNFPILSGWDALPHHSTGERTEEERREDVDMISP